MSYIPEKYRKYKVMVLLWILAFIISYVMYGETELRIFVILLFSCLGSAIAMHISFKKPMYVFAYVISVFILISVWFSYKEIFIGVILLYLTTAIIILVAIISWLKRPK